LRRSARAGGLASTVGIGHAITLGSGSCGSLTVGFLRSVTRLGALAGGFRRLLGGSAVGFLNAVASTVPTAVGLFHSVTGRGTLVGGTGQFLGGPAVGFFDSVA
jgi:hypothetical protein